MNETDCSLSENLFRLRPEKIGFIPDINIQFNSKYYSRKEMDNLVSP